MLTQEERILVADAALIIQDLARRSLLHLALGLGAEGVYNDSWGTSCDLAIRTANVLESAGSELTRIVERPVFVLIESKGGERSQAQERTGWAG